MARSAGRQAPASARRCSPAVLVPRHALCSMQSTGTAHHACTCAAGQGSCCRGRPQPPDGRQRPCAQHVCAAHCPGAILRLCGPVCRKATLCTRSCGSWRAGWHAHLRGCRLLGPPRQTLASGHAASCAPCKARIVREALRQGRAAGQTRLGRRHLFRRVDEGARRWRPRPAPSPGQPGPPGTWTWTCPRCVQHQPQHVGDRVQTLASWPPGSGQPGLQGHGHGAARGSHNALHMQALWLELSGPACGTWMSQQACACAATQRAGGSTGCACAAVLSAFGSLGPQPTQLPHMLPHMQGLEHMAVLWAGAGRTGNPTAEQGAPGRLSASRGWH